ncbi:MAG: hypothetical protein R8K22_04705 [Mariprofundaceae bacterium]
MSETNKDIPEVEVIESTPVEEAVADASPEKKSSRWPWVFLLLIVLAVIGFWKAPEPIRENLTALFHSFTTPVVPASQPSIQPAKLAAPVAIVSESTAPPINSEEVVQLLGAIEDLKQELFQTQQAQQALKQAQQNMMSMQLRTRLSWLVSPANHLLQLQLGWEEISLLPNLTNEDRELAKDMRMLAQNKLDQVGRWQQKMDHLTRLLAVPSYANVVPSSDNPWVDWIARQFSVKRSLSAQEKDILHLRQALTHIRQGLSLERWPDDDSWQKLRSRLHLHLVKYVADQTVNHEQADVLKLPISFTGVDADIERLRQAAQDWLERLS